MYEPCVVLAFRADLRTPISSSRTFVPVPFAAIIFKVAAVTPRDIDPPGTPRRDFSKVFCILYPTGLLFFLVGTEPVLRSSEVRCRSLRSWSSRILASSASFFFGIVRSTRVLFGGFLFILLQEPWNFSRGLSYFAEVRSLRLPSWPTSSRFRDDGPVQRADPV